MSSIKLKTLRHEAFLFHIQSKLMFNDYVCLVVGLENNTQNGEGWEGNLVRI